ncbi:hypothetical protein HNY73_000965 [Argiope bruennichi]|uniref:Uncharacterized protein n=1 Tax=Argiope bruennichi TaxID=94029 RepID=A0A8T0G416_ARGBR|nr:hypothetical protein HNY73_000965 [Argiope bruennichi]
MSGFPVRCQRSGDYKTKEWVYRIWSGEERRGRGCKRRLSRRLVGEHPGRKQLEQNTDRAGEDAQVRQSVATSAERKERGGNRGKISDEERRRGSPGGYI